jgi:LPS export ABC transporter permease LptG/LPS export ABC transporter permease LptF
MVGTGMKTLDRYVIREILPPFVIAMLVFTFILIIPFIIELAEQMIAKGVPWPMLLRLMVTLLPSALALTIPMALLIGILVAFGRLSADREVVVMMACGISPYRLLRPLAVLALFAWAASSWVLLKAMPDANQAFRELTLQIVADRAEGEVRPRVFFEDFPNMVLYVRDVPPTGGWQDVLAADTKNPAQPIIYLARTGRMLVDRQARTIQMVLQDGARHTTRLDDPSAYEVLTFEQMVVTLDPESVFPRTGPARGDRELSVAELRQRVRDLEAAGVSTHNPIMEIHKKFSIPVACFVFALLGLALGASNRKDGKLASFVMGIGVIFVYYVVMFSAQAMTKGYLIPAWLSMWVPNIVLGVAGVALLVSRARSADRPIRISLPGVAVPGWLTRMIEARRPMAPSSGVAPASDTTGSARPRRDRVVVVIRIPQVELPRPNLLDIYVAKQYLRILAMTVVAMLGLFYISTFIDLSDKWFKGQTTLSQITAFLWWSTPQFMAYIIALAVLLSALVTIGVLTKNSELIVMRACGVSLYRTAAPMLAFALVASAVLFGMEERVLALANRRADQLKHLIRGGSAQTFDVLNRKWIVGRNGEVYHYQFFNPRTGELAGLSVFAFDQRHQLTRRVFAQRAVHQRGAEGTTWQMSAGWTRDFGVKDAVPTFAPFDETTMPLETAEYFVTEVPEPRRMTYPQLDRYIQELRQSGYDVLEHEVELHRKVAFPFVTLVMTFIAVPFAVTTGRRGAMYGIGVGIVLALVYWTMISVFAAFGAGGLISPLLAAWAPNLLFGAAAVYLLLTVRT